MCYWEWSLDSSMEGYLASRRLIERPWGCLVYALKQQFSVFLEIHESEKSMLKTENICLNTCNKQTLIAGQKVKIS